MGVIKAINNSGHDKPYQWFGMECVIMVWDDETAPTGQVVYIELVNRNPGENNRMFQFVADPATVLEALGKLQIPNQTND